MNIAFLTLCFNENNNEAMNITTKILAKELVKKGHNVCIIAHRNSGEKKFEVMDGVKVVRAVRRISLPLPYFVNPATIINHVLAQAWGVRVARVKYGLDFDVLVTVSASPVIALRGVIGKLFARNARRVGVIKSFSAFERFNFFRMLNFNDCIITSSKEIRRLLVEQGVRKMIQVIPSPVDVTRCKKNSCGEVKRRGELLGKKMVLYYGHFNQFKGVEYLITATKYLSNDVVVVLIPSKNEDRHRYDDLIKSIAAPVLVERAEANVIGYVKLADVVVLPYPNLVSTEANPSCLIESLACGTPVVTSDLAPIREIVKDGINSVLVRPRDPESLARGIERVLASKSLRDRIVRNGMTVAARFDVRKVAKAYERVFNKI